MPLLLIIILAALAEAIVSFSGALLIILGKERIRRTAHFVVSFAVGALLGVAFLELIPEAIEMGSVEGVLPIVLVGIILFFILEKFLVWYHCHEGTCEVHTYTYLILWGDVLHNFIDGVIITLAFLADTRLGIVTTVAVIAHEIPQEIGDFAILINGGFERRRALFFNFLVSLSTVVGALLTYAFGAALESYLPVALALVAGNFIYLAATDLMPELHESAGVSHTVLQIALIVLGVFAVIAPEFLF